MRKQTASIPASGPKRRTTRIFHAVPLVVTWQGPQANRLVEETETASISCHGCCYVSRQRPKLNAAITLQVIDNTGNAGTARTAHAARAAWIRKSRRLNGLYLVGAELLTPQNIWGVDETPEDWAEFSDAEGANPAAFLAEVERLLRSAPATTHYELLDVQPSTSRSEVKRRFYQLARRFHPDHHMDHPEWTSRLLALMDVLTTAYRTLSNDKSRKEYDGLLFREFADTRIRAQTRASEFVEKARECMAEKNYAAGILWMHRAIGSEPNSSDYRAMLGQCLSAIPEYRREAIEQFEKAIQLDPRNLEAHFYYAKLLESMKLPGRARGHYQRALELDMNHREAREALIRLNVSSPRAASRTSLLDRLTGRRPG